MSGLMQTVMYQLGIKQYKSAAYHPEYQGALERFHQTLNMHIVWNMERTRIRECTWYYLHLERLYKNPGVQSLSVTVWTYSSWAIESLERDLVEG